MKDTRFWVIVCAMSLLIVATVAVMMLSAVYAGYVLGKDNAEIRTLIVERNNTVYMAPELNITLDMSKYTIQTTSTSSTSTSTTTVTVPVTTTTFKRFSSARGRLYQESDMTLESNKCFRNVSITYDRKYMAGTMYLMEDVDCKDAWKVEQDMGIERRVVEVWLIQQE